jgi:hypothetical protein
LASSRSKQIFKRWYDSGRSNVILKRKLDRSKTSKKTIATSPSMIIKQIHDRCYGSASGGYKNLVQANLESKEDQR